MTWLVRFHGPRDDPHSARKAVIVKASSIGLADEMFRHHFRGAVDIKITHFRGTVEAIITVDGIYYV